MQSNTELTNTLLAATQSVVLTQEFIESLDMSQLHELLKLVSDDIVRRNSIPELDDIPRDEVKVILRATRDGYIIDILDSDAKASALDALTGLLYSHGARSFINKGDEIHFIVRDEHPGSIVSAFNRNTGNSISTGIALTYFMSILTTPNFKPL